MMFLVGSLYDIVSILSLDRNSIGREGAIGLSEALKLIPTLQKL